MANFNFNKTILGGRLTADVELKQTPSAVPVCSFTVAVNRKTAKDQEQKTDFINCVAWRSTAEFISRYFKKGSSICVVGNIQTRSWTDPQSNQKRYATEVIVDEAMFVDSKSDAPATDFQNPYSPASTASTATPNYEELSNDDDLPF